MYAEGEGVKRQWGCLYDIFGYFGGYFFGKGQHCLQSADKDQPESPAVAGNWETARCC